LFLQALAAADVEAHAVLIGEGPELPKLRAMIKALPSNMRTRVSFAGYQRDAGGLLSAFDVFALSSRTEGTPMVILEAVSSEVPIVAFSVGGIPDLLSDQSAWLVPAGDTDAFGAALARALSDRDASAAKSKMAAATLADVLNPDRWIERIEHVYRRAAHYA
jgi:glycosyltransferase involved in cell wall biosynthesis